MTGKPATGDHFDGLKLNNTNSLGNPPTSRSKHAVVVGSINIDTRLSVPTLPDEGKTVTTDRSLVYPGGKGTNQVAGLAKLGHRVTLVGDVGADASSDVVYRTLEHWEVDTTGVYRKADVETGKAYIFVDPEGRSMITVLSGANAFLSADDLAAREQLFEGAQYCLVQTEIPLDAVLAALRTARHHGAKTILKPAACDVLPDEILQRVDILVPNLPELNTIVPGPGTIEERAARLAERCGGTVIVTLGADGCYLHSPGLRRHFPAADFDAVDTTGASDAFISALAARLMSGDDLPRAIELANYAAGYSTTHQGVAQALIDRLGLECANA